MALASDAARRIEDAVTRAEASTRGEIVVAVAERSDTYGAARAAFALALACVAAIATLALGAPPWLAVASWPVGTVLGWLVTAAPVVLRAVVPVDDVEREVAESAKAAFFDHGVNRTADRAGVLVYLSLVERRVTVLGDAGIHAVIGEEGWKVHVSEIVKAMHTGHPEAVADVVAAVGVVLARHFPPSGDNRNELADAVRRAWVLPGVCQRNLRAGTSTLATSKPVTMAPAMRNISKPLAAPSRNAPRRNASRLKKPKLPGTSKTSAGSKNTWAGRCVTRAHTLANAATENAAKNGANPEGRWRVARPVTSHAMPPAAMVAAR